MSTVEAFAERGTAWLIRNLQKRVPYSPENPYLAGALAPVNVESTVTDLKVTGRIPKELNGLLARIGPNPLNVANPGAYHWFLGDGMVHGLRLRDGKAQWYRNRWVGVDSVNKALGRPKAPGPRRGAIEVVNTNIIGHAGRLWALVEAGALPVELDGDLNTVKHGLFDSAVRTAFSAHPHLDPDTGNLHAVCYDPLYQNRVQHIVIDPAGQVARQVNVPVSHGPMIHDCAITQSQVVILDLPVTFSVKSMLQGSGLPYAWNPKHEARVGLLPKQGGAEEVRWFSVDPCYVFHPCNAYDLPDGSAILDVVVHERMFDRSLHGPESQKVTFERWKLDNATRRVQRTVLSETGQEFPRFDERLTGKPYRYAYSAGIDIDNQRPQPLIRHDLHTGKVDFHHYGPSHATGEVVFVPRAADSAEDDGWLLSYVYDLARARSQVVIVNAGDVGGEPQAVIELGVRVPMGFHGNWIAD